MYTIALMIREDDTAADSMYAWYNSAGLVVASFCYLQFFPPPYGEHGMKPSYMSIGLRRLACSELRIHIV